MDYELGTKECFDMFVSQNEVVIDEYELSEQVKNDYHYLLDCLRLGNNYFVENIQFYDNYFNITFLTNLDDSSNNDCILRIIYHYDKRDLTVFIVDKEETYHVISCDFNNEVAAKLINLINEYKNKIEINLLYIMELYIQYLKEKYVSYEYDVKTLTDRRKKKR